MEWGKVGYSGGKDSREHLAVDKSAAHLHTEYLYLGMYCCHTSSTQWAVESPASPPKKVQITQNKSFNRK